MSDNPPGLIEPEHWFPPATVDFLIRRLTALSKAGFGKAHVLDDDGVPVRFPVQIDGRVFIRVGYMESKADTRRRRLLRWEEEAAAGEAW